MQFSDELEFSHRDRKDIYQYVERYGTVDYEEAREALQMSPEAFGHHIAVLRRDGIIERQDDELRIAFDEGEVELHESDGVEYAVRQAREDDLSGLLGAIRSALDDKTYIVGESVADVVDHENVLLRHNEVESRMFFVATVGGDVVGWVSIAHPELDKLAHTAELTVGVLDEYRGHGIGTALLDRGLTWAGDQGYEKLYNSVPSTNDSAIDWLKSRGWETEATREKHYKIDGEYVDEVMMACWP